MSYNVDDEIKIIRQGQGVPATQMIPPNMIGLLLNGHPQLAGIQDGVSLRVIDAKCRMTAEWLLGWRIDLERFAHQLRAASP